MSRSAFNLASCAPQAIDLHLLGLHLTVTGKGMARISGKLPDLFAQHVRMHIQIARRLSNRYHAFADHPYRLKLELAADFLLCIVDLR